MRMPSTHLKVSHIAAFVKMLAALGPGAFAQHGGHYRARTYAVDELEQRRKRQKAARRARKITRQHRR